MAEFWIDYRHLAASGDHPIVGVILAIVVPLLLGIAYLTYFERKVLALIQRRKGPNVVGPFGLLQPLADGLKLLLKETVIPTGANSTVFMIAPLITFVLALVAWAVIPFNDGWVIANINVGILYLFAISARWVSTASSWRVGRPTRNTPSWARCAPRRRWCPTKSRWGSCW